ncbi:MAG: hypothetical protein ACD_57C00139G0001 [uncultured bacterium]|uniref:Hydrogenase assembly protein HupF n=1 Tax=Candidatus Curtissbacteria bacterium RIFOXYA1_FULL_41_14 TaxID=1797737 RepID=A0A1F5HGM2_9BACT|nr:MAG: hypothetical protein ACD_57C00139G0001 [uncultured bacterium]KKR65214.1 MAG: hypothetical protein UU05_C0025G0010 [Candidatus Curtissbacteria bacterium GW2011_GWA1_40_47]KKR76727.1 MAG: hypothetical protein UU19_C0023G0010 [Candidatus Curtissbacteria bacterium GW2011_GWD1_40_8]OGD78411.1 MAG: hypothetical protein A2683_02250 [Candidatus Curtissbacteria bacterium RIFCSPHIGHO2_01_FULL_34_40]OGE03274.1 MAG: hypothetical protein A2196_05950 [Candidatus Curtissbacteria bacterium RIFOXYA1_FUL
MCLALPLKVTSLSKNQAVMEDGRMVNCSLVKKVKMGDWLMVKSNLAVAKLTPSEAKSMCSALREISNGIKA